MKKNSISTVSRIVVFLCGIALIAVLFVPMWRIELDAPQYPEGLRLLIYANKIAGDVDIVNGLNHYIGMNTLHTEDFLEFTILPGIILFFVAMFFVLGEPFGNSILQRAYTSGKNLFRLQFHKTG